MGTGLLQCPFCCNENFSTREALKEHIVGILNNILCSKCGMKFENTNELIDHLDTECAINVKSEAQEDETTNNDQAEGNDDNENLNNVDESEQSQENSNDGVMYMCVMCNVQFKSIEEHLEKYHDGEEVLLETEEAENEPENTEQEEAEFLGFPNENNFEISNEPIDNDELNKAEEEQQYIENNGKAYEHKAKKVNRPWASGKFVIPPITENYAVENGKVKKITEEEAAEIDDRNAIIQIHQCPKCYLQFPKLEHYIKHTCNKSSEKRNKCVHCSTMFPNQQALNAHLKTHLKGQPSNTPNKVITLGPHTCDICNTMFPSFKSLRLHKRMHEPQKSKPIEPPVRQPEDSESREMFVCHVCNNTYDVLYEEAHMKSHSEEDNFYCVTCNRKFLTKENLEMHVKAHTNSKKFMCSYCKKAFTNFDALNDHVQNQCTKRSYECQYCGRRFSRPCEKVKHERIHTGEKPHVCQICGKSFRVSYCLTLHMRTHSGSRPYECPHCNKRFKSHSVYNHHLLIHSDVRAYKCPYCPKAFKTSVQLAGHKNSHIKPFSCTECNRPFASLYAVRAHMETHKRENSLKFDCWLCGATYARAFALKDHMKTQHAGENISEEVEELVSMDTGDAEEVGEGNENEIENEFVEEGEEEEEMATEQMQVEEIA